MAAGGGGGPHIRILDARSGQDLPGGSFFGGDPGSRTGFYVSGAVRPK